MKKIPLTQGQFAIVDDEDYEKLSQYKWYAHKTSYGTYMAVRAKRFGRQVRHISMHRQILGLKKGDGKIIDHINHNTLDNCRCNIRICTQSQNLQNMKPRKNHSSIFKGVYWNKKAKKWHAQIRNYGQLIHLGLFNSEIKAAKIYDKAARKLFGEFTLTNF